MSTVAGIILAAILLMMMGASNPSGVPSGPTVPSSAAMTVPNAGYAPHCGAGHYDNDVQRIVRVDPDKLAPGSSPATNPPC